MVVTAVLLAGCSSSYRVTTDSSRGDVSFEKFQEAVLGNAVIILRDSSISAHIHEVRRDSVIYEVPFQRPQSVALADVSSIKYTDRLQGMAEWAGVGALAGTGTVVALFSSFPKASSVGIALVGLIYGGIPGSVVGALAGLIIGHKYEYQLKDSSKK